MTYRLGRSASGGLKNTIKHADSCLLPDVLDTVDILPIWGYFVNM
jgi:hypothetical protein